MVLKFLKPSFLILGMSVALSTSAHAEVKDPELYFYPAGAWTTNVTNAAATGASTYSCTISNTFNNGFDVMFGGSNKWVEAMDVNFQQDIFTAGQSYSATLSVPGKASKSLSARASSGSMLSINMFDQKSLYESMKENAVVDMNVESNEFRFYLVSFAETAKKFERCMAGDPSFSGAAPNTTREAAGAMINESIAFEEAEAAGTPYSVTPMQVKETTRLGDLEVQPEVLQALDQPHAPDKPKQRYSEELARQIEQNPEIADVDAPQPLLAEPVTAAPVPSEPVALIEELPPIVEETPPPPKRETISMSSPPVKKTVEKARIEADFTGFEPINAASAQTQYPAAGGYDNGEDFGRKISELEAQIFELQRENKALNEEAKMAVSEQEEERLSISSENWNLERATMRYNEAERQIKRLGSQLQRERAQCNVEKKELEAMLFDPQVTNEQQLAKLADMEDKLLEAQSELNTQRMRYEERIRILESQLTSQ